MKTSRPFRLWKTYFAWIFFCSLILFLTNGLASLSRIVEYRFFIIDVLLTYGLLIFLGFLEAGIFAILMVLLEVFLERTFKRHLDLVFRGFLVAMLLAIWVILLQVIITFVL
jgi:hypothetical protein